MKIIKPKFWDKNYLTLFSLILLPFTLIYKLIFFFNRKTKDEKKFSIPIICIGNIYIGGTGKTPLSIKTFDILRDLKKNPVIIKKNYKNQRDEALLLKSYCKTILSKNRTEGITEAINKKYDCVILDDGYQDFEIYKNLNIISFNAMQKIGNGHTLPAGPLRESLKSLKRCQLILINGEKDLNFETKLKRYNPKLKFFYYSYRAANITNFKNKKLIAFAGIGNPKNFFDFLKFNHLNIVKEIEYPDHYEYSQNELDTLANLEKQYNASLITTEKDYLRINKIFRKRVSFLPIKVEFKEQNYANEIKKFIL